MHTTQGATMMTNSKQPQADARAFQEAGRQDGFTLFELLVAMAVFLVIGGAAIKLVRAHIPLVSSSQNQAGLNMAMRSAVAQMQIDVVNAGTGYTAVTQLLQRPWSLGITVQNRNGGAACNNAATFTYGPTCFDTLNIISADPSSQAVPTDSTGAGCADASTSNLFLAPIAPMTAAQLAAAYSVGDQVLLINNDGSYVATFTVTDKPTVAGTVVQIPHNPTTQGDPATGGVGTGGIANGADDPLGIAWTMIGDPKLLPPVQPSLANHPFTLGTQFCSSPADFAYKLSSVTYGVDATTDPTNPKLVRITGGVPSVVAEQIIGFRVGASTWNSTADTPYSYSAATDYFNDWNSIRALRISLIGRTPPNADVNDTFRNKFDNGPYRVEAVSVVINPRNLSMND
jgi:prepilin-type N-terminal cleavage/methylation domain-containing protein